MCAAILIWGVNCSPSDDCLTMEIMWNHVILFWASFARPCGSGTGRSAVGGWWAFWRLRLSNVASTSLRRARCELFVGARRTHENPRKPIGRRWHRMVETGSATEFSALFGFVSAWLVFLWIAFCSSSASFYSMSLSTQFMLELEQGGAYPPPSTIFLSTHASCDSRQGLNSASSFPFQNNSVGGHWWAACCARLETSCTSSNVPRLKYVKVLCFPAGVLQEDSSGVRRIWIILTTIRARNSSAKSSSRMPVLFVLTGDPFSCMHWIFPSLLQHFSVFFSHSLVPESVAKGSRL